MDEFLEAVVGVFESKFMCRTACCEGMMVSEPLSLGVDEIGRSILFGLNREPRGFCGSKMRRGQIEEEESRRGGRASINQFAFIKLYRHLVQMNR